MAGLASLAFMSAAFWIQGVQERWTLMERSANRVSWLGNVEMRLEMKRAQEVFTPAPAVIASAPTQAQAVNPVSRRSRKQGSTRHVRKRAVAKLAQPRPIASPFVPVATPATTVESVQADLQVRFHSLVDRIESQGLAALSESSIDTPLYWDPVPEPQPSRQGHRLGGPKRIRGGGQVLRAVVATTTSETHETPPAPTASTVEVYGPELKDVKWILTALNTHSIDAQIQRIRTELAAERSLRSSAPVYVSPIGPEPATAPESESNTLARSTDAAAAPSDLPPQPSPPVAQVEDAPWEQLVPAPSIAIAPVMTSHSPSDAEYSIQMNTQMDSQRWVGDVLVAKVGAPERGGAVARFESSSSMPPAQGRSGAHGPAEDVSPPAPPPAPLVPSTTLARRAFTKTVGIAASPGDEVSHAERQIYAADGRTERANGYFWTITRAPQFFPTLSRTRRSKSKDLAEVELLHLNDLMGMGRMEGSIQLDEHGVLFGHAPEGWTVQLSGVTAPARMINGTFYFLNVAPGTQILYFKDEHGRNRGGLPLPVLAATATYLPDADARTTRLSGWTIDASQERPTAVSQINVRVLGQDDASTVSLPSGAFVLENVAYWPGFPLWIDVAQANGYPQRHRLEVTSEQTSKDFYVLADEQVSGWTAQLENGLSAESAAVVAALKGALEKQTSNPLEVFSARTTIDTATDSRGSETYAISSVEQLMPDHQLSLGASRLVSVELPAGVSRLLVSSNRPGKDVVFSELFLPTPRVLCVVGPY